MISVVIPTLNAEARLALALDALIPAAVRGLVKEVVLVDGGSTDDTIKIADAFGAKIISSRAGRGGQLAAGARAAKGDWFLFLHGDTVLEESWEREAGVFIEKQVYSAGVFTLAFDANGLAPKLIAAGANMRARWGRLPYGDQGFLISRKTYDDIGGYADMPLFEDVEIIKRLLRVKGQRALHLFRAKAITSADRYRREGYMRRVIKNAVLLLRYQLGAPAEKLAKDYR